MGGRRRMTHTRLEGGVGGIGGQWSNEGSEVTISYGRPTISALDGEGAHLASPAGGEEIVVSGSNFGRNAPVTVSCNDAIDGRWFTASACVTEIPHRSVKCRTPAGAAGASSMNINGTG